MAIRSTRGFTLVELSIVLVIIGLVAGGVLVGRDLIEAARIRQQISQIEKFNTAAMTFRAKYGFLPGDLPEVQASELDFLERPGSVDHGNGDGSIGTGSTPASYPEISGEAMLFWADLSSGGLIEGSFTSYQYQLTPYSSIKERDLSRYVPAASIGPPGSYVTIYDYGDFIPAANRYQRNHHYQLIRFRPGASTAILDGQPFTRGSPLTPMQAKSIDQKIDDGLPETGRVQVCTSNDTASAQLDQTLSRALDEGVGSPWTDCADITPTPPLYNTANSDFANKHLCSLRIRAGF